jgi:hypothetical protein
MLSGYNVCEAQGLDTGFDGVSTYEVSTFYCQSDFGPKAAKEPIADGGLFSVVSQQAPYP